MKITIEHSTKPNGAKALGLGADWSLKSKQHIVLPEAITCEAVRLTYAEKACVQAQAKMRAELGNIDAHGAVTMPTLEDWEAVVDRWDGREVTPEFLRSSTPNAAKALAAGLEAIISVRVAGGESREQAIEWLKANGFDSAFQS
jgi:hypothetical protein